VGHRNVDGGGRGFLSVKPDCFRVVIDQQHVLVQESSTEQRELAFISNDLQRDTLAKPLKGRGNGTFYFLALGGKFKCHSGWTPFLF